MVGKHKLRINLSDEPAADALVSTRTVSLRERLLAKLLGRKQRVTVFVPGNQVGSVEIVEPADDLMTLADAAGVTREAVAADFAATNRSRRALHDRLVAQGALEPLPDPESVGVVPAHLDAVLDVLDGDPADLARRAGVPEADLAGWRDRLLGAV